MTDSAQTGLVLSPANAGAYLARRGVIAPDARVEVSELGGGVSCTVLAVRAGARRLVVKQALARLRVADEWTADQRRAITEAEALRVAAELDTESVPKVLDSDPRAHALTIEQAPEDWRNWKVVLLGGEIDSRIGARIGTAVGRWHRGTHGRADIASRFDDMEAFEQLRLGPYHRTVMARRPELAEPIGRCVERLLTEQRCLVHGDLSPKNVLVGESGDWILDFEVAHCGNPVFDLAFMLNHLFLKAIHRPQDRPRLTACAGAFLAAYESEAPRALVARPAELLAQLGCLMAARVDGKSPAEYLAPAERDCARALAAYLLLETPGTIDAAWELAAEVCR